MKELFEKVFIKSAEDLPKEVRGEDGLFKEIAVCKKNGKCDNWIYNAKWDAKLWMENIDWYLRPLPQPERSAEEIIRKVCNYSDSDELSPSDDITVGEALEAMHEFRNQGIDLPTKEEALEELNKYRNKLTNPLTNQEDFRVEVAWHYLFDWLLSRIKGC